MAKKVAAAEEAPTSLNILQRAIAIGRAYAQEHVPTSPKGGEKDFWQKQGPKIREALTITYNALKLGIEAEAGALGITWKMVSRPRVEALVIEAVKAWDDEFGWDAPNMDEKAEDTFYAFLAKKHLSDLFVADGF